MMLAILHQINARHDICLEVITLVHTRFPVRKKYIMYSTVRVSETVWILSLSHVIHSHVNPVGENDVERKVHTEDIIEMFNDHL